MQTSAIVGSLLGAALVVAWRIRETQTPVTAKKLLIPPLGMSTGFCMFLAPQMRVPWVWAACAFAAGALFFSYPLIHTSRLVREGDVVMMQQYVEQYVSIPQTAGLFFILAFGMLLPWRVVMFARYRELVTVAYRGG